MYNQRGRDRHDVLRSPLILHRQLKEGLTIVLLCYPVVTEVDGMTARTRHRDYCDYPPHKATWSSETDLQDGPVLGGEKPALAPEYGKQKSGA